MTPDPTPRWHAVLTSLVERVDRRGIGSLAEDEVLQLNRLYRRLTADLARARRDAPGSPTTERLNAFAGRVHGIIYRARRAPGEVVGRYFAETLPMRIADHLGAIGIAIGVFVVGTVFAFAFLQVHPQKAHYLVPPQIIENAEQGFREENFDKALDSWQQRPMYVSFYISNNVKVAFVAFAVGIGFAVPTVLILFQNGVVMGATGAIVHRNGLLPNLVGFISPHGAIELGAIFISAAAGMLLGWALVRPGRRTRKEALRRAAHDVIVLVVGAACMLVVAALFETFVAPLPVPNAIKYAIGGLNALLLCLYVAHGVMLRRRNPRNVD
jgi:uncharacterized membrane protein SpoIIM required for sporulation